MKKLYLLITVLIAASGASARQLSEGEARAIATQKVPSLTQGAKRVQGNGNAAGGDAPLYIFSSPAGGFAIVAGDSRMPNSVVAYSESGTLDLDDCPAALRAWLDDMSALIAKGEQGRVSRSTLDYTTPVAPMVTTKWNQMAPYNGLTPALGETEHCPTGCVATAMAQVMNYWKYPAEGGIGENSYSWRGQTLSVDFRESRYDWANMADVYDATSTAAENAAVAKLMYDCGVASCMDYGEKESGTNDVKCALAMVDMFGYSKETRLRMRSTLGEEEWFALVKSDLDAGRPLIYMGSTVQNEGHAFVCDGYDTEGLYHINWGWGGKCDGYFDLNTLEPESQGTGGAASGMGFSNSQSILSGCRIPEAGDEAAEGWEMHVYRFYVIPDDADGSTFSINPMITNLGYRPFEGKLLMHLSQEGEEEEETEILSEYRGSTAIVAGMITSLTLSGIEASELSDGKYELTFAVVPDSDPGTETVLAPITECEATSFEIKEGKLAYDPRPALTFSNIKVEGLDYYSTWEGVRCVFATLSADITNESGVTYSNDYSVTVEYDNGVFMPTSHITTDYYDAEPIGPGATLAVEVPVFFNVSSEVKFEISECVNPEGGSSQHPVLSGNIFSLEADFPYHELALAGAPEVTEAAGQVSISVPVQSCFGGNTKEIDEDSELEREVTCSIYDTASDNLEPVATATATYQGKVEEPKVLLFEPAAALPKGDYLARFSYTSAPYGFGQTGELNLGEEDEEFEGVPFSVLSPSALGEIGADAAEEGAATYGINGMRVQGNAPLAPGIYIRVSGNGAQKQYIK